MKEFERLSFDFKKAKRQLEHFKDLLQTTKSLGEREHILPFIRKNRQFAALFGNLSSVATRVDLFACEYPIFGDFVADLIVGDSRTNEYTIVEFEDGRPDSIFSKRVRSVREWSARFEHGSSQIVDWLWKLDEQSRTSSFLARLGSPVPTFLPMLVVGRDAGIANAQERDRFAWRTKKLLVDSKSLRVYTFDSLAMAADTFIETLFDIAKAPQDSGFA